MDLCFLFLDQFARVALWLLSCFCFLLMISFWNARDIGIRGLCIPLLHIEVRGVEFTDDTTVYLKSDLENLEKTEFAISTFCKASSALVNPNKSFAFWVRDVPIGLVLIYWY